MQLQDEGCFSILSAFLFVLRAATTRRFLTFIRLREELTVENNQLIDKSQLYICPVCTQTYVYQKDPAKTAGEAVYSRNRTKGRAEVRAS